MTRILQLVAVLSLSAGASAQTPDLRSLYGTWEFTRDTVVTIDGSGGASAIVKTVRYAVVDLSADAITTTVIYTTQREDSDLLLHRADEIRFAYRADGDLLVINDAFTVRVRAVGERLGLTWSNGDPGFNARTYDRIAPHTVPEALLGAWTLETFDSAGVPRTLPVRITPTKFVSGDDNWDSELRVMDGYLLRFRAFDVHITRGAETFRAFDAAPYHLSADGRSLRLDTVPSEGLTRTGAP